MDINIDPKVSKKSKKKSSKSEINNPADSLINYKLVVENIDTNKVLEELDLGKIHLLDNFFIELKVLQKIINNLLERYSYVDRFSIIFNSEGLVYSEKGNIITCNIKLINDITTKRKRIK